MLGVWSQTTHPFWHHKVLVFRVVFYFYSKWLKVMCIYIYVFGGSLSRLEKQKGWACSLNAGYFQSWGERRWQRFSFCWFFVRGEEKRELASAGGRDQSSRLLLNRQLSGHYTVGRVCPLSLSLPSGGHYTHSCMHTRTHTRSCSRDLKHTL